MKVDAQKLELIMASIPIGFLRLSQEAGITPNTLIRARSGKDLKPDTVGKIAIALGCSAEQIIKSE